MLKVVKEADTPYKLIKINLEDKAKHKPLSHVKLPTSVVGMLATEQKEATNKKFMLLKKMVEKMEERSPLKYALVRNASSLSPLNMARSGEGYSNKFGKLVDLLHLHKRFFQLMVRLLLRNNMIYFLKKKYRKT